MNTNQTENNFDNDTLYCICQKRSSEYDKEDFMIMCEECEDWLHGR